jgi:hypothetical protein
MRVGETYQDDHISQRERLMSISAISTCRGGTLDAGASSGREAERRAADHGTVHHLSRFKIGANAGDWWVIVQYPDRAAYDKAQESFAQDPAYQQATTEIAKFATRLSRELVSDI